VVYFTTLLPQTLLLTQVTQKHPRLLGFFFFVTR